MSSVIFFFDGHHLVANWPGTGLFRCVCVGQTDVLLSLVVGRILNQMSSGSWPRPRNRRVPHSNVNHTLQIGLRLQPRLAMMPDEQRQPSLSVSGDTSLG